MYYKRKIFIWISGYILERQCMGLVRTKKSMVKFMVDTQLLGVRPNIRFLFKKARIDGVTVAPF